MDAILTFHTGEVRAWGGYWESRLGELKAPDWAKACDFEEAMALEARTNPTGMATYAPTTWTSSEILDQINAGRRPDMKKVVGYFWAPGPSVAAGTEGPRHFVRRVQSWDLPSMVTLLGNTWTFEQIYKVWNEMPLTVPAGRRGKGPGIQEKKKAELKEQNLKVQEVKSFLHSLGLRHPKTQAEVKTLYRELGVFLAASTFLARTPTPVMDLPEAVIQDTKEHMRFRATCDERVTLGLRQAPCPALKLYRKLGYSEEIIATYMQASADAGADRVETVALGTGTYPLLSVDNVSAICSPAYRREKFGNKAAHAFWGKASALYEAWTKSRLEYYKRVEPQAPPRDVALEVDADHTQRMMFSIQNGFGNISNAIWSVLLSNPELEGLKKINGIAAARVLPAQPGAK
eukprot:s134_g4.t1